MNPAQQYLPTTEGVLVSCIEWMVQFEHTPLSSFFRQGLWRLTTAFDVPSRLHWLSLDAFIHSIDGVKRTFPYQSKCNFQIRISAQHVPSKHSMQPTSLFIVQIKMRNCWLCDTHGHPTARMCHAHYTSLKAYTNFVLCCANNVTSLSIVTTSYLYPDGNTWDKIKGFTILCLQRMSIIFLLHFRQSRLLTRHWANGHSWSAISRNDRTTAHLSASSKVRESNMIKGDSQSTRPFTGDWFSAVRVRDLPLVLVHFETAHKQMHSKHHGTMSKVKCRLQLASSHFLAKTKQKKKKRLMRTHYLIMQLFNRHFMHNLTCKITLLFRVINIPQGKMQFVLTGA